MRRSTFLPALTSTVLVAAVACASPGDTLPPVALVPTLDLPRFMGDWHVIAAIPTSFEKGAHNPMDSYRLEPDGTIATTFSYNADSFDGKLKTTESRGFVLDPKVPAVWGQQYVWPIKADYRISYLSPDYRVTVITREKRDYVWIMSRDKTMPEDELARLTAFVGSQGYDTSKLQRMPQR